jgi:hypothetical protein
MPITLMTAKGGDNKMKSLGAFNKKEPFTSTSKRMQKVVESGKKFDEFLMEARAPWADQPTERERYPRQSACEMRHRFIAFDHILIPIFVHGSHNSCF